MSKFEYLKLADAVAAEIANGALKIGDRLPPQRSFAYERGIAVSTASRVYGRMLRRGLVVGEVGRGTFISGQARRGVSAPTEPRGARIDLEFNYPMLPAQAALIAKSLEGLDRPEALEVALRQTTCTGTQAARTISAAFLSRKDWSPDAEQIVFTANGRQCIAAALAAVVAPGGRCGVESLTYPFIKGIAARLGVTLVPLAMDEHGVIPDSVQKAHRDAHLSALYVQPVIQIRSASRCRRRAAPISYASPRNSTSPSSKTPSMAFSATSPPLTALAPDSCIVVDSLSPRRSRRDWHSVSLSRPPRLRQSIIASVRSGGWTAAGYAFAAGQRLMGDGTASELSRLKRIDAIRRQQMAAKYLSDFEIQANNKSYHLWLSLPPHWRSQTFVAAAARREIAVTPSTTFAVAPGHAPNAVRLALGGPSIEQLEAGLRMLSGMLHTKEEDFDSTE